MAQAPNRTVLLLTELQRPGSEAAAGSKPGMRPSAATAAHTSTDPIGKGGKLAKQGSSNAAAAAAALAGAAEDMDTDEPVMVAEKPPAKHKQRPQHQQQQQAVVIKREPGLDAAVDPQALALAAPSAAAAAAEPDSSSRRVLEVFVEPPGGGKWAVTHLQLSQVKSFVDLWRQLQVALPELCLDKQAHRLKVVYLDAAGDWVMAMPDQRWQSFVEVAQRVLVTSAC